MTIRGTGAHAPTVYPGETAVADPAASPTVPTTLPVPTPGSAAVSALVQDLAQKTLDGLTAIKSTAITLTGVKTFADGLHIAQTKSIVADGTGATISGTWTIAGTTTISANVSFAGGSAQVHEDFNMEDDSRLFISGRCIPRSPRVAVADGNKRVGVHTGTSIDYAGKRFILAGTPASARVITLDHTNAVPSEGETMEFLWKDTGNTGTVYSFKREDATIVATLVSSAITAANFCTVEVEYVSGVWKLGANSGSAYDGVADYGVLAGAGA